MNANINKGQRTNELGYLKIRYKDPTGSRSKLINQPIVNAAQVLTKASMDTQFAIAVAGFGQRLNQSDYINNWQYDDTAKLVQNTIDARASSDKDGIRRNFLTLTELARALESTR